MSTCSARQPRRFQRRSIGRPIGALVGSAILLFVSVAWVAAAAPARSSHFTPVTPRTHTTSHLASAAATARATSTSLRNNVVGKRPHLKSAIAHPAKMTGSTMRSGSRNPAPKPAIISGPPAEITQSYAGMAENDGAGFEPPDPWVSVNSAYVVQAVNSTIRVANRSGQELMTIPSWALFGLGNDQAASDTRIIWDAFHGRWIGLSISFNSGFTANHLNLAISDTADPTLGWATHSFLYGTFLPDYPSIASSTDKIVVTDDVYDSLAGFAFDSGDFVTFTWASILGNGGIAAIECNAPPFIHPRAAQVLSSASDVHVIFEVTTDASQEYVRITGTGDCNNPINQYKDETPFTLFNPFTVAPDPRQFPGDTITNAVDERPTDAIWQNGQLWWVSTFPWTYDSGATFNDAVVLWHATTVPSGHAVEVGTEVISAGDGHDDFAGGIGMTRNGTLMTIYSESTTDDFVYTMANQIAPGLTIGTPIRVDYGDATYTGERWGDFAGVAMDPVGTGAVWATHEVAAADGTWRTDVVRLVADDTAPTTPGVPLGSVVAPTGLGVSVPVRLTWAAASDLVSGTVRYQVSQRVDGGPVEVSNSGLATTVRSLLIGHTYQFSVAAVDAVGNVGSFGPVSTLRPYLTQSTSSTTVTGSWSTSTSSAYSGGSTRFSSTAGATATFTATTARSIAIVATKSLTRGTFKVYVDGVYKGAISTYSTTTKFRQVVYQFSWATPGTHKIKIVVSGTAHHPRVDLDAFVVLR